MSYLNDLPHGLGETCPPGRPKVTKAEFLEWCQGFRIPEEDIKKYFMIVDLGGWVTVKRVPYDNPAPRRLGHGISHLEIRAGFEKDYYPE